VRRLPVKPPIPGRESVEPDSRRRSTLALMWPMRLRMRADYLTMTRIAVCLFFSPRAWTDETSRLRSLTDQCGWLCYDYSCSR